MKGKGPSRTVLALGRSDHTQRGPFKGKQAIDEKNTSISREKSQKERARETRFPASSPPSESRKEAKNWPNLRKENEGTWKERGSREGVDVDHGGKVQSFGRAPGGHVESERDPER